MTDPSLFELIKGFGSLGLLAAVLYWGYKIADRALTMLDARLAGLESAIREMSERFNMERFDDPS